MNFTDPGKRFVRAADQLSCELNGEIAILNLDSKLYFGLTGVGAVVWRRLENGCNFNDLIAAVTAEFDVPEQQCRADIQQLLAKLAQDGLIVPTDTAQ